MTSLAAGFAVIGVTIKVSFKLCVPPMIAPNAVTNLRKKAHWRAVDQQVVKTLRQVQKSGTLGVMYSYFFRRSGALSCGFMVHLFNKSASRGFQATFSDIHHAEPLLTGQLR